MVMPDVLGQLNLMKLPLSFGVVHASSAYCENCAPFSNPSAVMLVTSKSLSSFMGSQDVSMPNATANNMIDFFISLLF